MTNILSVLDTNSYFSIKEMLSLPIAAQQDSLLIPPLLF